MKNKNFTYLIGAILLLLGTSVSVSAQNFGTGTGWGNIGFSMPLVVDDDFQDYEFHYSWDNPDHGNSQHLLDEASGEIILGYIELTNTFNFPNSSANCIFDFYQCAFAPNFQTAYAYKNALENTANVSDGFVEISRSDSVYYERYGGVAPTVRGYFTIDLRQLATLEGIQYTHSSTGGTKRGFVLEYSKDDGTTWDTLRYQPGNTYSESYSLSDLFTYDTIYNDYNCDPSSYGMVWEDPIYEYDTGVMLRFLESSGQTVRIHDFKAYGELPSSAVLNRTSSDLILSIVDNKVSFKESANVQVYNLSGSLVRSNMNVRSISLNNFSKGIYLINAEAKGKVCSQKIVIR